MVRRSKQVLVGVACAALVMSGWDGHTGKSPLTALVIPPILADVQQIPNPLRGQYEGLLQPLFPQGNPAQGRYTGWRGSNDASLRVSWRQLQPTDPRTLPADAPDERKFDFGVIDTALRQLAIRNMRLMLRVYAYNSSGEGFYPNGRNIEVPDWLAARPGATTSYAGQSNTAAGWATQVVPNWNDSGYLDAFSQLLAALGRRYDRDERLSVFEFSGYGDFSENHIAYLRDWLGAPGPAPDESVAKLGYYSQWRDQSITADSVRRLVAANVNAFPNTRLVVNVPNPEIVRQLFADEVTKKLSAPVGIRSDCLGVYPMLPAWADLKDSYYVQKNDPLVNQIKDRLASTLVVTEWCQLPYEADAQTYYEAALHDVVTYHVSMTSSFNFPDWLATTPMLPVLYALWAKANTFSGYRYSVQVVAGSESILNGVAQIPLTWTNYGAAATVENWVVHYLLVDWWGNLIETLPSTMDLKTLVPTPGVGPGRMAIPASRTESVSVDMKTLAPGHYTLRAAVDWQQHKPGASYVMNYPPMNLARDGRDDLGSYPIETIDIPYNALFTPPGKDSARTPPGM
ncbi:hypothetical protein A5692_25295 [Mycobacterium sp. E342]|uniref:hypothetical protein n=1 Tax=Mycobacterium sp. E342 TaxID=1834147 RepID=UPI0008020A54|nr:hypothetical protein [Mycobacterium sp. E342]OBH27097.1 hypothetical protein A5692_25295 [Mycobacterium sp. E342]